MGNRIAELSAAFVMVGLMLSILIVLSGAFLIILVLILIFRVLLKSNGSAQNEGPVQKLGLFDAPASSWWVDRYDQWLFRLEETLGPNFSQSPGRLFAGSMILAMISGGALAAAGYWLVGPEVVLPIFIIAALGNGLSGYLLARPMTAMFDPFDDGGPPSLGGGAAGGVIIGDPLD